MRAIFFIRMAELTIFCACRQYTVAEDTLGEWMTGRKAPAVAKDSINRMANFGCIQIQMTLSSHGRRPGLDPNTRWARSPSQEGTIPSPQVSFVAIEG